MEVSAIESTGIHSLLTRIFRSREEELRHYWESVEIKERSPRP